MRALICDHGLRYAPDYPDPAPPPGEALVRVRLAGICNTDLELVRGYMAFQGVLTVGARRFDKTGWAG
jgi:alcohol dehydrogenase